MNPTYGTINTTVESIIRALTAAGNGVDATLQPVFFIGGVLMLVFACMKFMWSKDLAPIAAFVIQFCMLMGIVTLSSGWMSITESYVGAMGTYGASIGGFVVDQLNPASVMIRGLSLADKMYTENISWMRTIFGTTEDTVANLLMLIVCLGTILVAALMAVFLMLFYVVMKLASIVALIFLVFLLFDWSRFMAAPGIARFLAYGVQMLVMSLAAGLMFSVLDGLQLSDRMEADEALATLVIVAFFTFLFIKTTDIAREQISGMPMLSLNEFGNGLMRGAMAGAGMISRVGMGTLGGLGGMPQIPNMPSMSMGWRGGSGGASGATMGSAGGTPGTAQRMLNRGNEQRMFPPNRTIDGTWSEAKDIAPRAAQRMLGQSQRALPAPPRALPPR